LSENDLHTVEVIVQLGNITKNILGANNATNCGAVMGGPRNAHGVAFVVAFYPGACPSMARSNTIREAHLAATPEASGRDAERRCPPAPSVRLRAGSTWRNAGFAP
jgi:hypothetical protein